MKYLRKAFLPPLFVELGFGQGAMTMSSLKYESLQQWSKQMKWLCCVIQTGMQIPLQTTHAADFYAWLRFSHLELAPGLSRCQAKALQCRDNSRQVSCSDLQCSQSQNEPPKSIQMASEP